MLDLLLCRYSNIEYVMCLQAEQGLKLIYKAIEENNREKLYLKWLHDTARFEISFNEYYQSTLPYRKSTQAEKDEILRKWGE